MEISIIIPCYNEEKRIKKTLEKIWEYFKSKEIDFEIIVVDDGSRDKTVEIVEKWKEGKENIKLIKHPKNKGKGAAVKTGVMNAEGNLILFTDADLSTPIEEYEKLKKFIDSGYDISIGSRGLKESKILVPQPFFRRMIGRIFPFLVRLIVIRKFKDTQCGFKLFKKEVAKEIFKNLKTTGFAFDVEILYNSVKKRYKIKEVPVTWMNSPYSTVKIFRDSFKMFISLLKIRFLKK